MARTTAKAVADLLLDDYDKANKPSLSPFIEEAGELVTRVATCATDRSHTLTTEQLRLIEGRLAAHFYLVSDRRFIEKKTADAMGKFEATSHWEAAARLDTSGCLVAIGSGKGRKVARMDWGGKPVSEQTAYEDRD